ncbi:hypothetical protein BH20ACT8_BH20ACT8_10300 [soil metagenome]
MAAPAPDPPGHANADSDLPAGRDLACRDLLEPVDVDHQGGEAASSGSGALVSARAYISASSSRSPRSAWAEAQLIKGLTSSSAGRAACPAARSRAPGRRRHGPRRRRSRRAGSAARRPSRGRPPATGSPSRSQRSRNASMRTSASPRDCTADTSRTGRAAPPAARPCPSSARAYPVHRPTSPGLEPVAPRRGFVAVSVQLGQPTVDQAGGGGPAGGRRPVCGSSSCSVRAATSAMSGVSP